MPSQTTTPQVLVYRVKAAERCYVHASAYTKNSDLRLYSLSLCPFHSIAACLQ